MTTSRSWYGPRLAEKSLITIEQTDVDGRVRCRMLQTLVEYGRERLVASGDAAHVRAAHARYYCDLTIASVAAVRGERQQWWLRSIASNMGNLRAVLDLAVATADVETAHRIAGSLGWYWWFTGRAVEGSAWPALAAGTRARYRRGHEGSPARLGGLHPRPRLRAVGRPRGARSVASFTIQR